MNDRIVVLVDMDCFYCQVEARHNPNLKGKPMAVVQYNQWQGGGIIAVNYEARAYGVTRHIRGNEAKKKCPEIILVHVPSIRGKADLTRYRDAGREVVDVLCQYCDTVQRASVDEAYLDITSAVDVRYKELKGASVNSEHLKSSFIVGYSAEDSNNEDEREKGLSTWLNSVYQSELRDEMAEKLAVAALLVEEMRAAVYKSTGFHCSAGIAHNKILAKLSCGLHKPQRQTILPQSGIPVLYRSLPIKKIRGLGAKFGDVVMKQLNVTYMSELLQFSEAHLQKTFDEKSGSWLYNIARGIDDEPVMTRLTSKSVGCCKKFPGKLALSTKETVEHWLNELADEVAERLEKELLEGNRKATQFVVSYMQTIDGRDVSSSRCGTITSYEPKQIVQDAMELLKRSNTATGESLSWFPPLKFLGLSAGKFIEKDSQNTKIESFFKIAQKKEDIVPFKNDQTASENVIEKKIKLPSTPQNVCKEKKKSVSSGKNSFIFKFFKQEGLIGSPSLNKSEKVLEKEKENLLEENNENRSKQDPTGTSQQPTTSEGYTGIMNKTLRFMQVDESSNDSENQMEQWVSPGEIFPNLDEVDDDVAALLPSPLQKKLRIRILKHRETNNNKRNKGYGKGKCHKSLRYEKNLSKTVNELEDDPQPLPTHCVVNLKDEGSCNSERVEEEKNTNEDLPRNVSPEDIFTSNSLPEHKSNSCSSEEDGNTHAETFNFQETEINNFSESSKNLNTNLSKDMVNNIPLIPKASGGHLEGIPSNVLNNRKEISESEEIVKELCPHCNQYISLQEYPEHLDFHVAADLEREINRPSVSHSPSKISVQGKSPQKDGSGRRKRGRPIQKQVPPSADKKMRSITTFFAPVR